MKLLNRLFAAPALVLAMLVAQPGEAEARGSVKVNLGELAITTLADLGDRPELRIDGKQAKLGWLHKEYSIFEGPLWVFDEQGYVLFVRDGVDRTYINIPASEAVALGKSVGLDLPAEGSPLSVWDRWSGAIITFGVLVFAVWAGIRKQRRQRRIAA